VSTPRLKVLVVSTQFPSPPRSGFEMRVHHLVRELSRRHDVTLLSYARPDQRAAVAALRAQLPVEVVERSARSVRVKRLQQLASVASRRPFACRAVHSEAMQHAVDALCAREDFDVIQLESSLLCWLELPRSARVVLDEHNIEYEVFARMHDGERSVARRLFNRREDHRFRRFEQESWTRVDACVLTTAREEHIVWGRAPRTPTVVAANGVDLSFFQPPGTEPEPDTLVFNGILDYRPNLDAALHLVDEVWPRIVDRHPSARLEIVGRGGPAELRRLRRPGVALTGEVPDIRPHLARAAVVGVPIRMGGGTRLKVVEGLAMGKAMVSTSLGCEGVSVRDGEHLLIGDGAEAFATRVCELFEDGRRARRLGAAGRALMEREYSWAIAGTRLDALLARVAAPHGAVEALGVTARAAAVAG
jgi:glycosyltransferase involved in cell wall biosynthesis